VPPAAAAAGSSAVAVSEQAHAAAPPPSQADSWDAVLIRRQARHARRAGNTELALKLLQHGVQQHPQDAHLAVAAASAAAKLGDPQQAMQILGPFLEQQQDSNPYVLVAAAAAYRGLGDVASARHCYKAAAAVDPDNEVVLQAWGVLEGETGGHDAARALFRRALGARPRHMAAYVAWARLEGQAGNVPAARSLHQRANDINPMSVPNLHVSVLVAGAAAAAAATTAGSRLACMCKAARSSHLCRPCMCTHVVTAPVQNCMREVVAHNTRSRQQTPTCPADMTTFGVVKQVKTSHFSFMLLPPTHPCCCSTHVPSCC
jgi:tetratricopeptide (TPR) repeat protein